MASDPKYICVDTLWGPTYFLFPAWLGHNEMSKNISGEVLSVGFVSMLPFPKAYGMSDSLGIKSRDQDSRGIARQFNMRDDSDDRI